MLKKIVGFKLPLITDFENINFIVSHCYRETGDKFSINFNGSKGYLDNVEIVSEGAQMFGTNRISLMNFMTKKGTLMNKNIKIFHSEELGVVVTVGDEKPKIDGFKVVIAKNNIDYICITDPPQSHPQETLRQ